MARYICIDCGGRTGSKQVQRCRSCYERAHKAGLTGVSVAFNMRSEWLEADGVRIRFYGDLTCGAVEALRKTG